jgi:hypothetical protein
MLASAVGGLCRLSSSVRFVSDRKLCPGQKRGVFEMTSHYRSKRNAGLYGITHWSACGLNYGKDFRGFNESPKGVDCNRCKNTVEYREALEEVSKE